MRSRTLCWDDCSSQSTAHSKVRGVLSAVREICRVDPLTVEIHDRGLELAERHRFSLYDSIIVASRAICRDSLRTYGAALAAFGYVVHFTSKLALALPFSDTVTNRIPG